MQHERRGDPVQSFDLQHGEGMQVNKASAKGWPKRQEENPILQVSQRDDTGGQEREYFKKTGRPTELQADMLINDVKEGKHLNVLWIQQ